MKQPYSIKPVRLLIFLIMMLLVSGLFSCRAAFCEERGTAINANGNLNRAISVDPTGRSEGFSAVLYNNTNGLPTSEANAIAETSEGFLWIGSYAGLIRYDGNSFKRFDSTHGVTSVRCLYVDSRDRLWIGTNADGVTVMEKGEFQTWGRNEGVRSVVRAIAEDSDGVIYLATTEGILTIGQDMKPSEITEPGLSGNVINISIASRSLVLQQ